MLALWKKSSDKPRLYIKKQRHQFVDKSLHGQSYCFSNSHVQMRVLDLTEGWVKKELVLSTVLLEKMLARPLDSKKFKPINPERNQPWIFIEETDAEAEAPIFRPFDAKSQVIGKHPETGKDWGQEEKGGIEDEITGYHHQLNGNEFEQTPGDGDEWKGCGNAVLG